MKYLGHEYETATASYYTRDGKPCTQQTWRIDGGDWHTRFLVPPFTIDKVRDDAQDHNAEFHIRTIKDLSYEQAEKLKEETKCK